MSDQPGGGAPEQNTLTLEAVTELVTKTVNAAITGREKRFTETLGKTLEERFAKFAEALPKPAPADPNAEPADGKGKVDPETLKLRQQMDALTKKLEQSEKTAAEQTAKARAEKTRSSLTAALGKVVRPEAVPRLLKAFAADVTYDEATGDPVLPIGDGEFADIEAAIDTWAKSDEARAFIPAPNAGGAGSRPTTANRGQRVDPRSKPQSQWTEEDRKAAFELNAAEIQKRVDQNPFAV